MQAIFGDTKLIVSFFVGDRSGESAIVLMDDLRDRLANRVQLTGRLWSLEDIVARIDAMAPEPAKRGPYKKRAA